MSWVVFCGVLAPSTSTIERCCMDVRNLGIPLVPSILRGKSYKTKLDLGVSPKILRYQTRIGRQGDMQKSCGVSYVDFRSQTQRNVKMLPGLKNIPGQPRRHCCWLWQECLAGRLAMGIQVYVYRVCFTNLIQLFFAGSHPCSPFNGWILLGKSKPKAMFICPKCSFLFADFPSN